MKASLFVALAMLFGCGASPSPSSPRPAAPVTSEQPSGDVLFAAGRYEDAIVAYKQELERGERVPELQTFILFARAAHQVPDVQLVDELHAVEQAYPQSRWGHVAGVLATEVDRGTVLRQAVMAAGADLRAANESIETQRQRITALTTQTVELQTTLAAAREDRTHLQGQVRDLEDRSTAQEAHIKELEAELGALKKVDMERQP